MMEKMTRFFTVWLVVLCVVFAGFVVYSTFIDPYSYFQRKRAQERHARVEAKEAEEFTALLDAVVKKNEARE